MSERNDPPASTARYQDFAAAVKAAIERGATPSSPECAGDWHTFPDGENVCMCGAYWR